MPFKFVVSVPKERKAYQIEKDAPTAIGMKIGDSFDGNIIGLNGHTLKITGGSDKDGFGMRADLPGTGRKRVVIAEGPGYHPKKVGIRKRRSIRGDTVSTEISQINVVVQKSESGAKSVSDVLGKPESKEEAPKEEEPKKEETPEKKKEE